MKSYSDRPDKRKLNDGNALPLMEAFYTLQGEGYYQGSAAYFIRLGGCDVGCHWCDVKESWDASHHPVVALEKIVENALKYPARIAVITGGEPAMYNLEPLTLVLHNAGFRTHIETSGAYPVTGRWDWVCLSPKKRKEPVNSIYSIAGELKIVIFNQDDFKWAEKQAEKIGADCRLYLQPEWGKLNAVMGSIVEYVKKNPQWKVSMQVHKFMNIP